MKTSNAPKLNAAIIHETQNDTQTQDAFDDLVMRASHGDRRAIGAIAVAIGPKLLKEARAALGKDSAQDAEDVIQDFFLLLLEGTWPFDPAHGRAMQWMCRIVRSLARNGYHRRLDLDDEP